MSLSSGHEAMGKPIPNFRKQNAYTFAKECDFNSDEAMSLVNSMAEFLERDKPFEAMQACKGKLDVTGTYRLIAVLLTGEEA